MAVRVYELSKKLGITNKELIALLNEQGFSVVSHSSTVSPEAIVFIEQKFQKKTAVSAPQVSQTQPKSPISHLKPVPPTVADSKKLNQTAAHPLAAKNEKQNLMQANTAQQRTDHAIEPKPEGIILAPMNVSDFALTAKKPVSEVILMLLKQGIVSAKNQTLPEKTVAQLAHFYGIPIIQKKIDTQKEQESIHVKNQPTLEGQYVTRLPIVVVIGHVDHGKTTLLDFVRKTRVAAKEKGGITQHLGAYEVPTSQGNVIFLDTPGHEAFSKMRARGIKIADIAILVVAADDGVMPQTIEAIKHAQAINLPIIVAINKIDKASAGQIENVKRQLAQQNLVPEDWGGQTVCVAISAKLGQNIDALLDVISLQAELLELVANISIPAQGYVLESKLEKGRGFVATVICQHGQLHVGDFFKAGSITGKVSSLVDSYGKRVRVVGPSIPVQVAGFSQLPQAGDMFQVITQAESKKTLQTPELLSTAFIKTQATTKEALNIIVKTDNISSQEALLTSLAKISTKSVKDSHKECHVVHAAVGNVTESDIMLAANTQSIIYVLHTKTEASAAQLAQKERVEIRHFDIIYKLLEDVEALLQVGKAVKMVAKKIGEAIVLKVFDIKDLGVIAGAQVKTGRFTRDGHVVIWRGKQKVGSGSIKSLQRDRKSVKEVHAGFECAFLIEGFSQWEVDDRVECFNDVPAT